MMTKASVKAPAPGRPRVGAAVRPTPAPLQVEAPTWHPQAGGDFTRVPVTRLRPDAAVLERGAAPELEADRIAEHVTGSVRAQRRGGGGDDTLAALVAPGVAARVGQWSGQPLASGLRSEMEHHFGSDFGAVRVHTGPLAGRAARALAARAFAFGRHVVFGDGQYDAGSRAGRRLLVHELAHTAQQRSGNTQVVQRDTIDDVQDKLSYGLLDWAITDAEAIESLGLLGKIPAADLGKALGRLGSKYVNRLLNNLPDAAKSGEVYKRVIEAIGVAGLMPYATDQLSYGLFDWAVTDAEVTRVFNVFANLPAAEQEKFLLGLNRSGRLGRLLGNANTGHYALYVDPWLKTLTRGALTPDQRQIVRTIVEEAPKSAMDTLVLATGARYDVSVGPTTIPGRTAVPPNAGKLRETYLAIDHLPDAHVAHNVNLLRFGQFTKDPVKLSTGGETIVSGVYSAPQRELASNVKSKGDTASTLIHETGHSVDATLGWTIGPEPAKPERGGWKAYAADFNTCATDMVVDSGGAITTALSPIQRTDVIADMATAMGNRSANGLDAAIKARPWYGALSAATKRNVLRDDALPAIKIGLNSPWFVATGGGKHLGLHVYQEGYPSDWVRYRHEARTRMLTQYQFRDIGEWFAECYTAYYTPDKRGKGAKLNDKDPSTKTYFDTVVDTLAPTR